ncbi:hypothetical protein [Nocardioides taihuensis]|uniref:Uncharacterized protein n=1 Tax=Nocardioides taihuensis TaxID=1835606 RepID=A0ABW0BRA9_9ACTN
MSTAFEAEGYRIDLEQLYRAMYEQSVVEDGERIFHGNSSQVRAVKRLLNDLFGVPVGDTMHPLNNAIRKEAELRMAELGWAEKDQGHSARYVLFREV